MSMVGGILIMLELFNSPNFRREHCAEYSRCSYSTPTLGIGIAA